VPFLLRESNRLRPPAPVVKMCISCAANDQDPFFVQQDVTLTASLRAGSLKPMKIGLIGLPKAGKTTIFNALTRSDAEVAEYSSGKLEPNLAVVEVQDPRVATLSAMYHPKRTIYATIDFMDFVGVQRSDGSGDLFSGPAMGLVKSSDALAIVVRNFANDTLDSLLGPPNPVRDAEAVNAELLLSDLVLVETRLERISHDHQRGKKTPQSQAEQKVLETLHEALSADTPLREVSLTDDQRRAISGFQFMSRKPVLAILNSDEERYGSAPELLAALGTRYPSIEFAGDFEMQLAQLDDQEDAAAFMADLGITESVRSRLTTLAYEAVGLICFFTVSPDEVRAWTIHKGETAVDAAGTVHSDLARGFIRAECFTYDELVAAGSEKGVREAGHFRLEGKEYVVSDGDILHIRFSV
jgi:GTP-binding protein YchF